MDNNEKCDKFGTQRCICRDGFIREKGVCTAACGSYNSFDFEIKESFKDLKYIIQNAS